MGTAPTRTHFTGSQAITTSYATVGEDIDVGGFDSMLVQILLSAGSLTSVDFAFLADVATLMKLNSDGDALVRDEINHLIANGTTIAFRLDTRGMKTLSFQIKGDVTSGNVLGLIIAPDGTNNTTPTAIA